LTFGKSMVMAAFAWLIVSLFGSVPFIFGANLGPISAYFEAMSGFTTTGLTMFEMPGPGMINAPQTILLWRSLTQWVGGMGIMILFISMVVGAGKISKQLYSAEGGGGRARPDERSPEASVRSSARSVWKIYVLYTILAVLVLYFVGMPLFDSLNHAMTALATGGFSVSSDSFASYGIPVIIVTIFPMLAGAISFVTHRRFFDGDWKAFFKSYEFKLLLILVGVSTLILGWSVGWVDALFNTVSAQTGTGFSSVNVIGGSGWGALQKSILVVQMVIGGGFGSTAGAIKLIRTIIMIMTLYWLVKRALLPDSAVVPFKLGDREFPKEAILQTTIFAFTYVILLVAGSLITMAVLPGESAIDCIFESASAQGTVGLSVGITGNAMPSILKVVYIIQMWIGRLEVIPVVAFFSYIIGKVPRRRSPV
ncbi:MAG: TrkH family potassium uptake protein, partial [Hadesarchaea archaeon]|nr:TrkH family potassium uptake protein [Hadesarchaea archaeon]